MQCFGILHFPLGKLQHLLSQALLALLQQQLIFRTTGNQVCQQRIGLLALFFQFRLGLIQAYLGLLQLCFLPLKLIFCLSNRIGSLIQFIQPLLVRLGNFLDHVQTVQKIRKAVGFEQH